ncbi:MAG TPA: DMT family transporter [Acidobacteriota bacterium]|nr:DMT family transporter [Acidobacteriota bacterium]
MARPGPARLVILLTIGILSVSCGAVFVRLASAPALAVAAYRVLWGTLLFAPALAVGPGRELASLTWRDWLHLAFSGAALALHFALWIASLSYTTVASSVLLVDTTPFFIGLASRWLMDKPCHRRFWMGLTVTFLGCVVIFRGDWSQSQNSMKGNALALAGAIAFAAYLLAGARARQKLSLFAYVWPVYSAAAIVLFGICQIARTPMRGYSTSTYFFMFLLGLIPQGIGHTTYNWALRWLSPALVALVGLAEPVGASLLAYFVLNESLTVWKLIGGGVVLLGIYLATRPDPATN